MTSPLNKAIQLSELMIVQQTNLLSMTSDLISNLFLPCTAKTLQGCVPWRDDSLFPPLMKAGRLGLLWSPTNFPGCCPIRAGCQAAAGTLQAGLSCSPCRPTVGHQAGRGSGEGGDPFPRLSLSSPRVWVMRVT